MIATVYWMGLIVVFCLAAFWGVDFPFCLLAALLWSALAAVSPIVTLFYVMRKLGGYNV